MIVFNILWFIPALLVEIFTCSPISRLWDLSIPGTCVWYSTFWLVLGLVELIADIILFVLPLREIVKLQLSRRNKLMLSLLFGLGAMFVIFSSPKLFWYVFSSIISGILRLALCYQGRKISYGMYMISSLLVKYTLSDFLCDSGCRWWCHLAKRSLGRRCYLRLSGNISTYFHQRRTILSNMRHKYDINSSSNSNKKSHSRSAGSSILIAVGHDQILTNRAQTTQVSALATAENRYQRKSSSS